MQRKRMPKLQKNKLQNKETKRNKAKLASGHKAKADAELLRMLLNKETKLKQNQKNKLTADARKQMQKL
jgi:hypothetical protein